MPAKTEYLSSRGQRWLKVSAGILGGFILATAIHLVLGAYIEDRAVMLMTAAYSTFFLWIFLMIVAFLFRNGWHAWLTYLVCTAICALLIHIQLP